MVNREAAREALAQAKTELDGNPLEAWRIVTSWMKRIQQTGDPILLCDAWDVSGLCHAHFGRDLEANRCFEQAARHADESQDMERVCRSRKNLGVSLTNMHATHHALRCFLEAREIALREGFHLLAAQAENNIAVIHNQNGNHEAALEIFLRLLDETPALGLSETIARYNVVETLLALGSLDRVAVQIRAGRLYARQEGKLLLLDGFTVFSGILFRRRRKFGAAAECLEKAVMRCRTAHLVEESVKASSELILLYRETGDMERMMYHCHETISFGKTVGMMEETARAYEMLIDGFRSFRDGTSAWEASRAYAVFLMEREAHDAIRTRILLEMELDLFDHGRARRRLERELAIDPLTGLDSYRVMAQKVAERRHRLKGPSAMLFLDLDNLKTVNDTFGHGVGDRLILAFAREISTALPPEGVATRKSGDEFVLYLPQTDRSEAAIFAEAFLRSAAVPRQVGTAQIGLYCSIGIAIDVDGTRSVAWLTDQADLAMLCAKRNGRARVEFARMQPEGGGT